MPLAWGQGGQTGTTGWELGGTRLAYEWAQWLLSAGAWRLCHHSGTEARTYWRPQDFLRHLCLAASHGLSHRTRSVPKSGQEPLAPALRGRRASAQGVRQGEAQEGKAGLRPDRKRTARQLPPG